ncbi:MAG: tRNA uridine-5-carboxymethylaminomethyl(34) synthesis GTPase MnmE [Bacteroidales bacterium]|nr:tRNA uridine-5-carboxymethylaminomethyl(34) synthesis GTPase MnmE [Bacteroidales bacterium]
MESLNSANIVAPATVPGTGAVGIIRVSGADAITIASAIFKPAKGNRSTRATLKNTDSYKLTFGRITEGEKLIDEVLAAIFRAPNSYTGENAVEIYCHASSFIMNKIQILLLNTASKLFKDKTISAPLRMAEPGEFTKRAFLNGKMDLAQAEAVADLIASETEASHSIAMNQMRGGFSKELRAMRESLLNLCALVELELDFSEEDVEFADRKHLTALLENIHKKINELSSSFAEGNAIKNGIPVAIVGAVNTGKSTLLNLLVGEERAIVSPIQGTTRDTIEDNVNIAGTLFRFIDTAGIRNTTETIEMMGIERTWQKLKESSVIILVTDATRENTILPSLKSIAEKRRKEQKLIVVANKCDMLKERGGLEQKIKEHCKKLKLTGVTVICTSLKKEREESIKSITHQLSLYGKGFLSNLQGKTYVTNLRHYQALKDAEISIERVLEGIRLNFPTDLVAQDLRQATDDLGSIIGEISSQEILSHIFSHFCIGK